MQKKTEIRRGSRRVAAWVYTVINPLIEALKDGKTLLKEKNWTWRYETKNLEFILPLDGYIDLASIPNFEGFLKAHPEVERKRKRHEELRVALSENCRIAFNYLIELQAFQDKVSSSRSTYGEYPGGAVPEMDFAKLIAQYIVNYIKDLPGYYTTSKFWARYEPEFSQFRTGKEFEKLEAAGKQLENHDEKLLARLKDLRSVLCKKYDVPDAPTLTSIMIE